MTLLILDLAGIFFFAVSGSLLAARRNFDVVGSLLLGSLAGLGGGVARDLIISQGVPQAFTDPVYLLPPVLAALLVFLHVLGVQRYRRTLLVFDAAGLALFCVTGTLTALAAGLHPVSSALLGVATAVGGGLLRDVVANEVPQLFNPRGVYAVPAMLGAGLVSLFHVLGVFNPVVGTAVAVLVFTLRVLSLRYGWRIPLAGRTSGAESLDS
ncbi:trimeric intracellular cation channel family protein [Arthrobacter sp. 7Tela_A1]|uniref:trimeric intracellular cation channel family protein n=1 Tax=Arthrobacter sp. 7Tela_A1 TaxID=3093745 RepID=UPI003BB64046